MIIYTSSSSNLAKQIKKLRVKQKITQPALAKECGIHVETYRKWETGKGSTYEAKNMDGAMVESYGKKYNYNNVEEVIQSMIDFGHMKN